MPNYELFRDDVETIDEDEAETHAKIIEVMTEGMHKVREKTGKDVRISHAKAFGVLKGQLTVRTGLPHELAQGLFAKPATYDVLVRLATAPGEINDDAKVNTVRGMAIKILGVTGPKLPGHTADTQDWVLDTGKEFLAAGPKEFLQAFKPNAEIAPKMSDTTKGIVSDLSRATNAALNAVGLNSEKLDFYGHPKRHPMAEAYYSQVPMRFGAYIAKLGVVPDTPGLRALEDQEYDPKTFDAFREATNDFFRSQPAEFSVQVQLNTGLDEMPIENAQAKWSEDGSQYVEVARLLLPVQSGWDAGKDASFENLSFSPAHSLAEHRPLGGVSRARLVVYGALSSLRHRENNVAETEPETLSALP